MVSAPQIPLLEQLLRDAVVTFRGAPYQKQDIDMDCTTAVRHALDYLLRDAFKSIGWWRPDDLIAELMGQLRLEVSENEDYWERFDRVAQAAAKRLTIRIPNCLETSLHREEALYFEHQDALLEGEDPKWLPLWVVRALDGRSSEEKHHAYLLWYAHGCFPTKWKHQAHLDYPWYRK